MRVQLVLSARFQPNKSVLAQVHLPDTVDKGTLLLEPLDKLGIRYVRSLVQPNEVAAKIVIV